MFISFLESPNAVLAKAKASECSSSESCSTVKPYFLRNLATSAKQLNKLTDSFTSTPFDEKFSSRALTNLAEQ
eukprot:11054261-Heterocapsa_arctica.AAC.1